MSAEIASAEGPAHARSRFVLLAVLVLSLALGARAWNLDWSLPSITEEAVPAHTAIGMWGFDDGEPSLDPGTAGWPALSFYIQRGLQQVHYLLGDFDDPLDYYVAFRLDPTAVILLGRATSLVALLVVTFVALWVGRSVAGFSGAAMAGLLCTTSPLILRHSQLVDPDSLVAMFSALALVGLLRIARHGRAVDYLWSGLWIGLGAGSKYTPALVALGLWAVHVERVRSEGRPIRFLGLDDRRLWWAALATVATFIATSPYLLGDLAVLRRDFGYQASHMSAGHFGHAERGLGIVRYLVHTLPGALGLLGFLAGIAGLVLGTSDRAGGRVLVWYTLPWLLVLGAFHTSFDRYMLPVVLPLSLGAGILLARIGRRWVAVALGAVLLVQPALASLEYQRLQSTPGTRDLAREWVAGHVDRQHDVIAMEYHGPDLAIDDPEGVEASPVFARLDAAQRERLRAREVYRVVRIPMYSVRADLTGYYYDLRHYLACDWIILSGGVSRRYRSDPERFGRQLAFYELLDELADPVWSVSPEGRMRGPRIDIYRMDDALRARVGERLGELALDDYRQWQGKVHTPHFLDFLLTVAGYAEFAEDWPQAARYYEGVAGVASSPELQAAALEKAGAAHAIAGHFDRAVLLFERLSENPGRRLSALANLALIAEDRGDVQAARRHYETLLEEDADGEVGQWARARMADLPER